MQLQDVLFSQGFGTRRVCAGLVQQGHVRLPDGAEWVVCNDPTQDLDLTPGDGFEVQGRVWPYHPRAYILLNKPAGYECSHKPSAWPPIYSLLPPPLRQRPQKGAIQGVQAVGRLDQDTTGLLLLTDDGALIHRLSSPKHHVPKIYEVVLADPLRGDEPERLCAGVVLHDDPQPVRAAACVPTGAQHLQLTLTQGKYHQVKRMLAAVGHRVVGLHHSQMGQLRLPSDLAPGQWVWLTADDLARAQQAA